ncbi:MAG: cytidylate kinase family protein, partial [Chloroflexi bacterium]|nr:cytidylate kinase family protein [Chloroflexota bacterium]
ESPALTPTLSLKGRGGESTGSLVIAISGQPGAGAKDIGHRLAEDLGCDYFDRLILERVARRLGATVEAVESRERRPSTWSERFQRFLEKAAERGALSGWAADPYYLPPSAIDLMPVDEASRGPKTRPYEIDDLEYAKALAEEIKEISKQGDAVIVHSAACVVLPRSPATFRVGVIAPPETRVQNLIARRGLAEVEPAYRELVERDRARVALIRRGFHANPDDPSLFDLVLNTGTLATEDAADQIATAVRARMERRRGEAVIAPEPRAAVPRAPFEEIPGETQERLKALAKVDIFRALPESQVREIARLGRFVKIPEGTLLASEDTVGEVVYAVLGGEVELSAESEVGRITVRVTQGGESFPLAAIIGTGKIITRAQAMSDLELWRVDRMLLQDYLRRRPDIGLKVYDVAARVMADRYRQTLYRLTHATERALTRSRARVSL